ncbi:hypothetical protein CYY_003919 [Polysphondylium violaceum]|uniref:Mitochondrial substrate carrier family protein n=1 Tax=Polysphondylium violaceum TaxID=133409 RepID=A0A8J4V0S8_9MYCE|nr:hypothetical protein CYY_003919 [Polysphondylium violaceum]
MSFSTSDKNESQIKQFIVSGVAGMIASAITHPIDSLKVRMQLQGELESTTQQIINNAAKTAKPEKGTLRMLSHIHQTEGLFTLYKGLSASLLRQATYTTTRFGLYGVIKDILNKDNKAFPFHKKVLVGMISGAGGAIVGTPADVIMVRMQADGKLPPQQRRNYTSAFNGLYRITKEEGLLSLWKGCSPNIIRAMFMTAGQIASYDQAKQMMITSGYFQDNINTHLIASTIAAFVASLVTSPMDVIKTRIMNSSKSSTVYKGTFDCFAQTFKSEGVAAFYKGFGPYFLRLGPHTILTFIFVEQLSSLWKKCSNMWK